MDHPMTPCTVTTGFFVLRRCGRPPVAGCPACRRPICAIHVAEQGLCPDCAAQRGFFGNPQAGSSHHRRGFRSASARDFGDASMLRILNSFDRAPFDPDSGDETDYDADGGGDDSLVDS
jgi:hypothetical protein